MISRKDLFSFFVFVVLLFVTFIGCKKDDSISNPGPTQANVIMPLKAGNEWDYTIAIYDSTEKLISNKEEQQKIIRDTTILNETWSIMNSGGNSMNSMSLYINRQDGLYNSIIDSLIPYLSLKYPVNKGDTYSYYADNFIIVSTDTSITVPAGKFSCINYYLEEKKNGILLFYGYIFASPQVGTIKSEGYFKKKSGKFYKSNESILKSYKLL